MQDFNFARLPRLRRFAIGGWALWALFAVQGANASTPPLTISGTPPTSILGWHTYRFTPTAKGPSGYTLRFSISGKPSWATFSTSTGTLSGMPKTSNVGSSTTVVISVSDGVAHASLAPFTLKVLRNIVPTISGAPPTIATVGTLYAFTPKASESDGDPISFTALNKPAWASFSIATGRLSGTPTAANVGTYSNIKIRVSTGYASAVLGPWSITVKQAASGNTGSATLHWTAPTTNTNGSGLTDLAGYHIYYGNSPSAMTKVITVANPATTSYTVSNLASGTWYFAINAYTTGGLESALSNTGSKAIP